MITELENIGKRPPSDLALEEIVLGACMLEKPAFDSVADILKPETFYSEKHQLIFEAFLALFGANEPVDLMTVATQLMSTKKLEAVGGPQKIAELTGKVSSSANILYHARILQQYYLKRKLIGLGNQLVAQGYEASVDPFELMEEVEQSLFELNQGTEKRGFVPVGELYQDTITEIEEASKKPDGLTGIATPFSKLNELTGGLQKTDFIVIGARPAMGKTSFALSLAMEPALNGIPVGVCQLEMGRRQLVKRLFSIESEINGTKIRKGDLDKREWDQLLSKTARLAKAPLYIDDTPAITHIELRAKARRLKSKHGIEMLLIDYIQLMKGKSKHGRNGNREQEISEISQSCKQLAKDLEMPVIALAQLSRAVENRPDKRPMLSDLRESGSLEQDSDIVGFLYRPEYYGIETDEMGNSTKGYGELIIAKHRNGGLEDIPLKWEGEKTKYSDWDGLTFQDTTENIPFM